jgi:hypothetical protein
VIDALDAPNPGVSLREALDTGEVDRYFSWKIWFWVKGAVSRPLRATNWTVLTKQITRYHQLGQDPLALEVLRLELETSDPMDDLARGMLFTFLAPRDQSGPKFLRRYAGALTDMGERALFVEMALAHPDGRLRQIGGEVELPVEHLTPTLVQQRLARRSWKTVASLAKNPYALKTFQWNRLGPPNIGTLDEILAGFEAMPQLKDRAQELSHWLLQCHFGQIITDGETFQRVCRLGGPEAVQMAAKKLPAQHLHQGTDALLEVMKGLISALPAGTVSGPVSASQSAIFARWAKEQQHRRHLDCVNAVTLFNLSVLFRSGKAGDLDLRIDDVELLLDQIKESPHLAWALGDYIASLQKGLPRDETAAIPLRSLMRMARWRAGWTKDELTASLLEMCGHSISTQALHTLILPQLFRELDGSYNVEQMRATYFALAEGIIEKQYATDLLALVLGHLLALKTPGSQRLQDILRARRGIADAYEIASKAIDGAPSESGSAHAALMGRVAVRHHLDEYDESWKRMVIPAVEQKSREAVEWLASVACLRLADKHEWLAAENEQLLYSVLARQEGAGAPRILSRPLDEQLRQGCRTLDPQARHATLIQLVSCLCPSDPHARQELLCRAAAAGLFNDRKPLLEMLGRQIMLRELAVE